MTVIRKLSNTLGDVSGLLPVLVCEKTSLPPQNNLSVYYSRKKLQTKGMGFASKAKIDDQRL